MAGKVTIQDIADALGVSRNTVSKAINNTGILADATREKILQKAAEMGYKQFSYVNISDLYKSDGTITASNSTPVVPITYKEIALFSTSFLGNSHFSSTMLDKFQRDISQFGYSLTMHRIDVDHPTQLPPSFNKERTSGIICFEVFDYTCARMICDLGLPTLFVDGPVPYGHEPLMTDVLLMDNTTHMFTFVKEMARRGKTKIGFIGKINHCRSFYERYMGFRNAMFGEGLEYKEEYCIIGDLNEPRYPTPKHYRTYLKEEISRMKELPEVFICANDFVAIDVLRVLKELDLSVPEDVYLCGFDNSSESKLTTPPLTTIHIHTQIMGFSASHLLLSRIKQPYLNLRTIYTDTDIVYRASTEN